MKRYFSKEDFICFLNLLEENKPSTIHIESIEDGSVESHNFMKMQFSGNTIILYDHPYAVVGIIQDSPLQTWEELAEVVYEDLTVEGEYKMFIESD